MEEGEQTKTKQCSRSTRLRARLQRLREHHSKCLSRHMEQEKQQTQPSEGPNQEGEISSLPELPSELFADSKSLEMSQDSESNTEICTPESSHSSVAEDPDVPPLRRTDSIWLTKEYLESISKVSDGSESSMSSIEISDDAYTPPKDSTCGSSSEDSYDLPSPCSIGTSSSKDNKGARNCWKLWTVTSHRLTEADSSFCSSSSGSSRSKRRQSTPDDSVDDIAPIGSSTPKRRKSDIDDPETGSSTPKRRKSDIDDPETENAKRRSWSFAEVHVKVQEELTECVDT